MYYYGIRSYTSHRIRGAAIEENGKILGDIMEIEIMLMAVDPQAQTSKLAYLHQKRKNFIEKGQNKSRSSWADLKKGIFALENTKKVSLFLVFWMVPEGYF